MMSSDPDPDLLLDRLTQNAAKFPDKVAVTFLGSGPNGGKVEQSLTYKQLVHQTKSLANRLRKSGLNKGDRAVLVYPPSLDYMVAFLACLFANVVAVPVFPPNPARKDSLWMFSRIVQGCGAEFALTSVSYNHMKKLSGIKDALTRLKRPAAAWPEQLQWIVTNDGKTQLTETLESPAPVARNDIAFLQYTSGSTSEPKGVMITHGNLAHNLTIITRELQAVDDTVVVSWLPQYHDMGLIGSYLGVLYCGGNGYYMSPLSFLQRPMLWIEAISKYRATHLQAPNFAFKLTARKHTSTAVKLNLSSVRHVINGAEPVDQESIEAFATAFAPFGLKEKVIYPTYGLAEHTVFVCSGGTQRLVVSKKSLQVDGKVVLVAENDTEEITTQLLGCGFPARQGVDVRIVDPETSQQLADDSVGEIWIDSPSKAAGYFGKPQESKEDFSAHLAGDSADALFLKTGDLGFLHNQELFICGRLKDLIIVGGRNYYPQDIETTAEASSGALRPGCSAAFTIDPTHAGGEEVALVAELRELPNSKDVDTICDPLVNAIRSAVSQEQSLAISHIVLLKPKTVPKTTSGKIARSWCRKAYVGETLSVVYKKSFQATQAALEIEGSATTSTPKPSRTLSPEQIEELRGLGREEILSKLANDVSKVGGISPDAIDKNVALVTIMDSLSISQFKGQLEAEYAVSISDEYLFRDTTTLTKLVEVVKLGYAPDDGEGTSEDGATRPSPAAPPSTGNAGGLAGALGCPPGVVCCVIM